MDGRRTNVGIILFDGVEVLDFAGPYEVFSRTRLEPGVASRSTSESAPFRVFTLARTREPITATGGLRVLPDHAREDAPKVDILLVPGGFGTRPLLDDDDMLGWIRQLAGAAEHVTSVCTGSLLLAGAGLLSGLRATTHWGALDLLAEIDGSVAVERERRVVHDVITSSAGVSAGIDMALEVVSRLRGADVAADTARYMDYDWRGGAEPPQVRRERVR